MPKLFNIRLPSLVVALAFGLSSVAVGQGNASEVDTERETMLVVVVDSLVQGFRVWNDQEEMYQYIRRNFGKVFEKEEWPVDIEFERWNVNLPEGGLQLRIWFKSLEEETFGDLVFRAWVTLHDNGEEIDYKILSVRTYPRPGQQMNGSVNDIITKAAKDVAKKLNKDKFVKSR